MIFKNIFITVGTTKFTELIDKIQENEIIQKFIFLGCKQLNIQAGNYNIDSFDYEIFKKSNIIVTIYKYADNLHEDMSKSDLIIGHAGAGTCLEGLRLKKRMLVVINENLMDNHQFELAFELEKNNYLKNCYLSSLADTLQNYKKFSFKSFPEQNKKILPSVIDNLLKNLN